MVDVPKDNRKAIGNLGEQLAALYLVERGMVIRVSNWKCRSGEIDHVADDQGVLVFIEVRTRRETGTFGTPFESIDSRKIRQVRETALVYLKQHQLLDKPIRFDVVSVLLNKDGQLIKMEHIQGAF